jgi:hypothetical protein
MITQIELKEMVTYDPLTGHFTWLVDRGTNKLKGKRCGNIECDGYVSCCFNRKRYKAHRLAYLYMTGDWPKLEIDHINRNRQDNRWENLREATRSENASNRAYCKKFKLV